MNRLAVFVLATIAAMVLAGPAAAQFANADLAGRVTDASGVSPLL